MIRLRKYGGITLLLAALILAVQGGVSLLVRTNRYAGIFGHPSGTRLWPTCASGKIFSVQVLPLPELDVDEVSIGEDWHSAMNISCAPNT